LALIPTENQIFMACLDAHLYEIEYSINTYPLSYKINYLILCWSRISVLFIKNKEKQSDLPGGTRQVLLVSLSNQFKHGFTE
jgi:hypothetical protein